MPREKRFETMKLEIPFETVYQDMFELTDMFTHNIKKALKYLDEGKQVCFEVPNEDNALYHMIKTDQGQFLYKIQPTQREPQELEPIEVLNLLFEKAPFIAAIGVESSKF